MKKHLYADIAVPSIPKDTLTYSVPEGLHDNVIPGIRAIVPMGRRLLMGIVVQVHEHHPDFAVKAVQQVLDTEAVIPEPIRTLCSWVARYYCCSLGDALKAALPQGMDVDSERQISLKTNDELQWIRATGKSRIKHDILRELSTGEIISEEILRSKVGANSISAQLRDLHLEGIIEIETVLERPTARPRLVNSVRLLPEWTNEGRISELQKALERRAPKQVNLIMVLWQGWKSGLRSIIMSDLIRQARATSTQVRALAEKEIVEVFEEELVRTYTPILEERKTHYVPTSEQRKILDTIISAIDHRNTQPMLLYGITASGKTQVYIEAVRHALAQGKSSLVLLPEISLTPQLTARFRNAFGDKAAVMHSRLSIGERYDAWRLTLRGDYQVVVGVRSAVFAPLRNLGIIIVDEEHDQSYKQTDPDPRYNARDTAVMRAHLEGIPVLLGSATPSLESWLNASVGKYSLLRLKNRINDVQMPTVQIVDMTEAWKRHLVKGSLSQQLIDALHERIEKKELSIVFQNRRGFSPHIECNDCDFVEECENCSISLTFHKDGNSLRCHYCGYAKKTPVVCPRCGGTDFEKIGSGTQRIEDELRAVLPEARILRMDSDTTKRKGSHELMLTAFQQGEYDILLGTQMVAKGLDFEQVTLVGIVSAEQSLRFPDFRSSERTIQMLTQVAGRAGRGKEPGKVIIQAAQPDHPVFEYVLTHDYEGFLKEEVESRRSLMYPPFSRMICLLISSENENAAKRSAEKYYQALKKEAAFFVMHPPQPALLSKINKRFRFQLVIRVTKPNDPDGTRLNTALQLAAEEYLRSTTSRNVSISIDVDPQYLL